MGAAQQPAPPPANRRLWVIIGVLTALLAGAVVLIGLLWARGANPPAATDGARPTPSSTVPPSAAPTPSAEAPGATAAPGTPRPTSCEELYSPAMVDAFAPLVLNPAWLDDAELDLGIGEDDPVLQAVINANDSLLCQWAMPDGPSGAGVSTTVVWLDQADSATVTAELTDRGDNCIEQQGGVRCTSAETADEGYFGESHFVRDGLWLATEYSNAGPEGYTLDMVDNLWPEG